MKTSVVMPIHNEEHYLSYSLTPLLKAPVDEFIFVLDRCTDGSESVIHRFAAYRPQCKIVYKTETRWLNSAAEAYDFGAQHASGDYVYFIDADVVIDLKIFDDKNWEKGNALRFRYYDYDLHGTRFKCTYEKVLLKISEKLRLSTGHFATVIAFERSHWKKTRHEWPPEDMEGFRKNPKFVVKHILMQEYKKSFIHIGTTNCLHLRPGLTKSQQELQGIARYLLDDPIWRVVLHSVLYFKISTLISFLYAKWGRYGDLKKWLRLI